MERPVTSSSSAGQAPRGPIALERDEAEVATARAAFGAWLRAERESRGIPLEDVARVTKIQIRALERLEDAAFDELPADVFVRGFIRNYARVVGLAADKVLQRYDDCGVTPGPAASARARAMMSLYDAPAATATTARRAPQTTPPAGMVPEVAEGAAPVVEVAPAKKPRAPRQGASPTGSNPPASSPAKKKSRGGKRRSKKSVDAAPVAPVAPVVAPVEPEVDDFEMTIVVEPVIAAPVVIVAPPRVHRRSRPTPIPSLVIDDDDPDSAERAQVARELDEKLAKDKAGRNFLPQSLLDGDRGTRQGGLTLAVIILLIVATLTLSYLMRRPSSSGEGVTSLPGSGVVA